MYDGFSFYKSVQYKTVNHLIFVASKFGDFKRLIMVFLNLKFEIIFYSLRVYCSKVGFGDDTNTSTLRNPMCFQLLIPASL